MKLLIIQPAHYQSRSNLRLHKTKKRKLVNLSLPYLAALAPKEWSITIVDEQLTDIDFGASVDLVAISTWTINSFRAYEIADIFRKRKIPVIIGGPHTYFHADEAAEHCDAVGIGEGEEIFPEMLRDAAAGKLKKIYKASNYHSLKNLPLPRYDLLDLTKYGFFKTFAVQSSRGCPFKCEFCSERFYLGTRYRYRPVEEVIEEIRYTKAKNIFIADSNFAGKREHAMKLMEAMIRLKVRWSTLWPAYLCKDQEFMDLATKSGLLHVNIGMESIDQKTLTEMNKRGNKARDYEEILYNLKKRGISYSLNFIFGWDTEDISVFDSTLRFLKKNKVPVAYFNILTPHKGTPLYDRMKAEDRIIDIENIGRWPGIVCYIKPKYCSAKELEQHVIKIHNDFYSYCSILSRLPLPITKANIASWIINLSQRKIAKKENIGENFDNF